VLVTTNPQTNLWDTILPESCRGLPPELEAVDRLLDDPAFFEPYRAHFHASLGRPSIPIESYLRLMFLKHRYRLGYETLCREVADSISWRRFCRIGLGEAVPHPTTLMKITSRCGEATIEALNEALLAKAARAKVLKTDKVRADTTVVEANVAYPTDSGLLTKVVAAIAVLVARIHAAGGATRTKVQDRRRSARRKAHEIGAKLRLRNDEARSAVLGITGELAVLAEKTTADAEAVVRNARRGLRRAGADASGRLRCLVAELDTTIARGRQLVAQARTRLGGRARPRLSPPGQVAHRLRRAYQPPQARLWLGAHAARRSRRCPDVVRPGRARPQQRDDRPPPGGKGLHRDGYPGPGQDPARSGGHWSSPPNRPPRTPLPADPGLRPTPARSGA
jgi:IS5 family transposase